MMDPNKGEPAPRYRKALNGRPNFVHPLAHAHQGCPEFGRGGEGTFLQELTEATEWNHHNPEQTPES